jgi:hypothetical protein
VDEIGRSLVARVVDENLVEKLLKDFEANGVDQTDEQMSELMAAALAEVRSTTW